VFIFLSFLFMVACGLFTEPGLLLLGVINLLGALAMMTFNYSRAREKRPIYPAHAIPSQRWSGAFDANGPKAV